MNREQLSLTLHLVLPSTALRIAVVCLLLAVAACGRTSLTEGQYIERANAHKAASEYQASIIEFRNALRLNPDNAMARRVLAELYIRMEDGVAAEEQLRWLSRSQPLGEQGVRLLGRALLLQGRFEDLLSEVRVESGFSPIGRAEILALRARAYVFSRQTAEARRLTDEAKRLGPGVLAVLEAEIVLALSAGDLERARSLLDSALDRFERNPRLWLMKGQLGSGNDAQRAFQRAIELAPDGVLTASVQEAYAGMVATKLRLGDSEGAQRDAQEFFDRAPQSFWANYAQGLVAYRRADYRDAHRYLVLAHNQTPDYPPLLLLLGATNFALGNYNQAEGQLARFLKQVPGHARAQVLLGAARLRTQGPQQALDQYRAAAATAADDEALLAMIGAAALEAGDSRAGIEYLRLAVAADPEALSAQRQLAAAYLRYGAYDEAIRELRLLIGKEQSVAPSLLLAIAQARKGETAEALRSVERLARENPDDLDVLYVLGVVRATNEDRVGAGKAFRRMLAVEPRSIRARVQLSLMDAQAGRHDQARRWLTEGLELNPTDVTLMLASAQLEASRGREGEAVSWLERARAADPAALRPRVLLVRHYLAVGQTRDALQIAQEAAAAAPDNAVALGLLADSQLTAGESLAAVQTLGKVVEQAPTSAEAYTRLGRAQAQVNELEGAVVSLRRALSLQPDYMPAQVALTRLMIRRGELSEALKLADGLAVRQPTDAAGFLLQGEVRMIERDYAAAAAAFSKAWIRERTARTTTLYAEALRASGNSKRALEILREWLLESGDDPRVRLALAETLHVAGQLAGAEREYLAVLRQAPENVIALNNLASLLHGRNDERALEYATQAHRLRPDLGPVTDTLGWLLVDRNIDLERGRELLRRAAAQSPSNPEVQFHLAAALARTGEPVEARSILTSALEMRGAFPSRRQATALLKELDRP